MTVPHAGSRDSLLSLGCAAAGVAMAIAAGRAFERGDGFELTNAPYLMAPVRLLARLNPFHEPPPAVPVFKKLPWFELTESQSMLLLLYFAGLAAVFSAFFCLARARAWCPL